MVKNFAGLPGLLHITITNAKGTKVAERDQTFCPDSEGGRIRPDAPATSAFPTSCPTNPFTLGSVWGIHRGWAANTFSWGADSTPVKLADGKYTAKISVAKRYRDFFGINGGAKTVKVTVRTISEEPPGPMRGPCSQPAPPAKPNAARPTGGQSVPKGPKPDLRSLPASASGSSRSRPSPAPRSGTSSPSPPTCGTRVPRRWSSTASAAETRR